ncbi:Cilia- and flagella-associated protein 57 [Hondaea fermentalgiana]|uniref:Cilia-and flagella-associated protein 57 n=1 Tax=Hondaea fermentalgiana TaxID=2315210 RepID=A0A2R5GZ13_9STRA|nr:Cilia- and flagella-associated protein 57 [Hondaea fermentalgiana]|eukprot:GBG33254.1 Cilia- and flagella-associated protein 57 [Hondaea fermentalgiana]
MESKEEKPAGEGLRPDGASDDAGANGNGANNATGNVDGENGGNTGSTKGTAGGSGTGSANLVPRHVFGLKADVADSVWFLEENLIMYPAGNNVIVYHTDTRVQKFIQGTEGCAGITALSVCPSRKFVAVAERGQRASVSIYDLGTLKKRKLLTTSECNSSEYVSVCFSSNKQLLTLGGGPDWSLVLWQWEKAKALCAVKVSNGAGAPLTRCSFNPVDPSVACVTGDGIFKAFRIVESIFKPMPNLLGQMEPKRFTAHLWLNDDRVLLGTDAGELILFEAGEYLATLECAPRNNKAISYMVTISDGFIAGCEGGDLRVYIATEDDAGYYHETKMLNISEAGNQSAGNQFVASKSPSAFSVAPVRRGMTAATTFQTQNTQLQQMQQLQQEDTFEETIMSIAVSPSEEFAVVALNTNQLARVRLTSSDLLKQDEMTSQVLVDPFHRQGLGNTARITGLDVCVRKPLIVTCGLDRSVRIWDYLDNRNELTKFFNEEAHSVSFHPSGLHILVGFSDKLRLMNLLMDDLRLAKELPIKACRECQFANGGHMFAAVNGNTIQVFNTYTCECIRTMRGHNGKVRSLFWSHNDAQLVSAGMDGAVYQWDLKENKRDGEYVKKGCNYTSAICNKAGDAVFAVGNDAMLREVEFPVSVVTKEIESRSTLSQLAMSTSQRMLFGASADSGRPGSIRSFKFPLTGDYAEFSSLAGPVTRMRLSWEDQFLFVAGEDGTLQIFEVREKDGRGGVAGVAGVAGGSPAGAAFDSVMAQSLQYAEEILVTKTDLEEKNALMAELKSKVDELTLHNEYQLRLKDMNYNEKIKEVTEKFTQELEQDKNRYELLREEKNDLEMEYADKIKQVQDQHQQKLQEIESTYQTKIMAEVERYQSLCRERDQQKTQWDKQQQMLVESHERYINEITLDYEQQLQDDHELKLQVVGEVEDIQREFDETMRQLEGDIDKEIELLKAKYESKLGAEREATLRFKGENGIMKKKFSALGKDIEFQKEDIKTILTKEEDLLAQIRALEKDIQSLRAEIRDRDETIGDKEKKIYDLKKKNQELEKFKFVLDYKIKELKRQIEPRENEIADMKDQIKEMDHELEQYHKRNAELDVMIGDLRSKLDAMQKAIMTNRQRLTDQKTRMLRFKGALHECARHAQHPERLRSQVEAMFQASMNDEVKSETVDVDIKREYLRQKDFLEKSADLLKRRLSTDVQRHKEENMSIMERNMGLIKEIGDLRDQIRHTRMQSAAEAPETAMVFSGATLPGGPSAPASSKKRSPPAAARRIRQRGNEASSPDVLTAASSFSNNASSSETKASPGPGSATAFDDSMTPEEAQLLEEQRSEIGRLKAYLLQLKEQLQAQRPGSGREKLAPIDA